MPQTSRMGYIYEPQGEPTWFQTFVAFMNQLDADEYASFEDPLLMLTGGGMITLDTGTDELTWTEDFTLMSMLTGGLITIEPGTLAGFEAGKIAYIDVSRPMTGSQIKTMAVTDSIRDNRNYVFIAIRRGNSVYFRNHSDRQAFSGFDYRGASKVTTGSAASGGGTTTGSINLGILKGSMWQLTVTALGNTVNSDIEFFADSGLTEQLYSQTGKDCYTSPFVDGSSWFVGDLTNGLIYYRITNNGANASVYELEPVGFGEMS